jgi:hypothetical protein
MLVIFLSEVKPVDHGDSLSLECSVFPQALVKVKDTKNEVWRV